MNSLSATSSSVFSTVEDGGMHPVKTFDDLLEVLGADSKGLVIEKIPSVLKKIHCESINIESTIRSFEVFFKIQNMSNSEDFIEKFDPILDFIFEKIDFTYEEFVESLIAYLQSKFKNNPCHETALACAFHVNLTAILFSIEGEALFFQIFAELSERDLLKHTVIILDRLVDAFFKKDEVTAEDFYHFTRIMIIFDPESRLKVAVKHSEKILKFMEDIGEDSQSPFETIACFVDRFVWMGCLRMTQEKEWTVLYNYFIRAAKQVIDVVDKSKMTELAKVWREIAQDDDEIIYLGWVGLCFVFASYTYIFESDETLLSLENPLKLNEFINISGYLLAVCSDFDSFAEKIEAVFRMIKVNFQIWDVVEGFLSRESMMAHDKIRLLCSFSTKYNFSLSSRVEGIKTIFENTSLKNGLQDYANISEGINLLESRIVTLFPDSHDPLCVKALKVCYLWWGKVLLNTHAWKQKSASLSNAEIEESFAARKNLRLVELASRLTFLRHKLQDNGIKLDELVGRQVLLWENGRYIIVTAKPSPP